MCFSREPGCRPAIFADCTDQADQDAEVPSHRHSSLSLDESIMQKWLPCEIEASQMMPACAGSV
jgi:hypothetical protein